MATESDALALAQVLNTFCYYMSGMGNSNPWWDTPAKDIVIAAGELFAANPNVTQAEIEKLTGWTADSSAYFDMNIVAMELGTGMNDTIPLFGDLVQLLPDSTGQNTIIPIFITFTILSTIIIALRLWSRFSILGRIQSFDWAALVSYVVIVAWCALSVYERLAQGKYDSYCDTSYNQANRAMAAYWMGMTLYPIAVLSVKVALLLFYHQISNWQPMRWAVYITAGISIINAFAAMFLWLFQCNYADIWNHGVDPTQVCYYKQLPLVLGTGVVNIITDVIIWILPLPLVWRLQLYPRERILAIFTFGLGALACIASIARLVTVDKYLYYGNGSTIPINAWAMVELNLALICSSAPALRALVIKHAPKILSYAYATGSSKSAGSFGSDTNAKQSQAEKTFVVTHVSERSHSYDSKV